MNQKKTPTYTEKFRENPWILSTLLLGIIVLIFLVGSLYEEKIEIKTEKISEVDKLIENKIIFVYSSGCSACHKQIEIFGEDWEKYIRSGLTLDCATHSSRICEGIRVTPSWVVNNGTDYIIIKEGVIQ